jgi:hypothetical protein
VYVPSRADDLDREIGALGDTLSGRGLSPERQAQLAADLSNRLADRFLIRGEREDLDRAIALAEGAVTDEPSSPLAAIVARTNLAGLLGERFRIDADLSDIDRAISLQRDALDAADEAHAVRPVLLGNLAASSRSTASPRDT